jgi:activator of HSP90 ATPase
MRPLRRQRDYNRTTLLKFQEVKMADSFEVSTLIPARPEQIFNAWLDGTEHSAFTGSKASGEAKIGSKFTAWDGYISGTNLELEPYHRIVQAWRTTEFPTETPDSRLEILLEAVDMDTKVTLIHTNLPEGQGQDYYQGWLDYYFEPLKTHFSRGA